MASSAMSSSLYVLTSVLLLVQIAFAANPVLNICSTTKNFSANSPFKNNLDQLLSSLSSETPPSGFSVQTVTGKRPNQSVFGMALCRGDINSRECTSCVNDATTNVVQLCPNNKEAFIWFDTCFLKYSDSKFFGTIDVHHDRFLEAVGNSTERFLEAVVKLLKELSQEASLAPKLFAAGKDDLGNEGQLFGLVECTRDLSSVDCKNCIDATIDVLPKDNVSTGGRILGASCSIRYEIFEFF